MSPVVIAGPSGAGKTVIFKNVLARHAEQIALSVSATTRSKREGEVDGEQYHFLTLEQFQEKIHNGEFLEYEEVYPGGFYGTLKSEVERIVNSGKLPLLELDVNGALAIKKMYPDALIIFIAPPSIEILEERLRKRNSETEEKLQERLARVQYELSRQNEFDVVVVNDILDIACNSVVDAIESKMFVKI